jgi:hypothetical protein
MMVVTRLQLRIACFLLLLFFFPQFLAYVGLVLEQLFTVLLSFLCFCYAYFKRIEIPRVGLFFSILMLMLLLVSLVRSSNELVVRDFFEIMKPIYFFSFFLFGFAYLKDVSSVRGLLKPFLLCVVCLCVLGIGEALSSSVNGFANTVYKDLRGGVQFKAVASFISPYTFGAFLFLPLFVSFFCMVGEVRRSKRYVYLLVFLLCFVTLVLTQSRTTLLALFLVLPWVFFLVFWCRWFHGRKIVLMLGGGFFGLVVAGFPLLIVFAEEHLRYLYSGLSIVFESALSGGMDALIYSTPSISNRYEQMEYVIDKQDLVPVFGVGILKSEVMPESFYAMYLLRVGLLGMAMHMVMVIGVVLTSVRMSKKIATFDPLISNVLLALAAYFMTFPFSYFSSAVNDQSRTGFVFYFIVGGMLALRHTYSKRRL